jgi:hypothetical protein
MRSRTTPAAADAGRAQAGDDRGSRLAEQAAIEALIPAGKRRLMDMDYRRALAVPEDQRSPEQLRVIEDRAALDAQIEAISYAAAQREAEIEDLAE